MFKEIDITRNPHFFIYFNEQRFDALAWLEANNPSALSELQNKRTMKVEELVKFFPSESVLVI